MRSGRWLASLQQRVVDGDGRSQAPVTVSFTWVSVLVMMAKRVSSLAVPVVALIASSGGIGLVSLLSPS